MAMAFRFDGVKAAHDMAAKGWDIATLASQSGLSTRTVYRFLNNELQTLRSARAIAAAMGFSVRRYLMSQQEVA